ncbi:MULTISPECIES: terminase [Mannheimia]|uniref:Terminase n=1 Tax=Mannheimia pernigra TaxID=111844 RepID=A0ABD7A7B8_9PAST|nr:MULTISPECIES: terminase [Mannheimia]QLB42055.1 terminase [Mannheimia pernigra]QTM00707.1 terminase [Mannheimia sp. ZY171111]
MPKIQRQVTILRPTNYGKEENNYKHLYILLTDPCFDGETGKEDMILNVSCSSIKGDKALDETCILKAGIHEFITRDSFIFYRHLRIDTLADIRSNIEQGYFIQKALINDEIYHAILKGVLSSKSVAARYKRFLKNAIRQNACPDIVTQNEP